MILGEDLLLLCESDLRKSKEKATEALEQFNILKNQQEEITSNLKRKCNEYHLAATVSELYTLEFEPSNRHTPECVCYEQTNRQHQSESNQDLEKLQPLFEVARLSLFEAQKQVVGARERLHTLNRKAQKALDSVEAERQTKLTLTRLNRKRAYFEARHSKESENLKKENIWDQLSNLQEEIRQARIKQATARRKLWNAKQSLRKYEQRLNDHFLLKE